MTDVWNVLESNPEEVSVSVSESKSGISPHESIDPDSPILDPYTC